MSEQNPKPQQNEDDFYEGMLPEDFYAKHAEEWGDADESLETTEQSAEESADTSDSEGEATRYSHDTPSPWAGNVTVGPNSRGSIFDTPAQAEHNAQSPDAQTEEAPEREIKLTAVNNAADKGFEKGNRTPKPEEDVDAAREAVEKSLKSEEATTDEPTAKQRAEASAKISETATAAAHTVKRRARQERSNRGKDASRVAVDKARAEGKAKRAAQEAEAPQTPPILGERDGASEKSAKQTVVNQGTDGQEYVSEPTTAPQERARVPKEAATDARPVPEAVIPTQEQTEEPAAPAEESKTALEGTVIPPKVTSQDRYDAELKAMAAAAGYDPNESEATTPEPKPKQKSESKSEATRTSAEEIDEDVLGAMGGADSGRPAKRRGRKNRTTNPEETTTESVAPSAEEPAPQADTKARPTPADMPGARGARKGGPSPADMPRRRPVAEETSASEPEIAQAEAPAPEADKTEAPTATPEAEKTRENLKLTGAMETRVSDRYLEDSDNEDRAMVNPDKGYLGVFDGMGGHAAGGEAAEAARDHFERWLGGDRPEFKTVEEAKQYMQDLMLSAHRVVEQAGENDGDHRRATTANVAFIEEFEDGTYAIVGNTGDSLMYHVDANNRVINQVTANQSTNDPTSNHPDRYNFVTNSLGGTDKPYNPVDPEQKGAWAYNDEIRAIKLNPGDKLISVSDGITGDAKSEELTPEEFRDACSQPTPEETAKRFIEVSTGFDKKTDDKTVSVLFIGESTTKTEEAKPSDDEVLANLDFETPDFAEDVLATAGNRDTRTPEEVEADDAAAEAAKADADADKTYDPSAIRGNLNLGGFGDRARNLGAAALGEDADTSWADAFVDNLDDLEESPAPASTSSRPSPFDVFSDEPLANPLSVTRSGEAAAAAARAEADNEDNEDNDDDESGSRNLADDLLGDFGDPEPRRASRRERVGAAFRTGWDKARTYFTGRDLDSTTPDRDGRIAKRQLRVVAGAVGATVLAGALFSLAGSDNSNEGPTHVGKGPSASAEATPGAKVDSGKTESKPSASPSASAEKHTHAPEHKESKKPSATVDDDHRNEHGAGVTTGNKARTIHAGNEDLKISADGSEVTITLDRGGTVWDGLDHAERELHLNSSDTSTAESVQSMKLKPGQDRQMKTGSSYTFKVQGGKLVAKK